MFFFVLLINMMRFVSQTTFRQFPSLLLNGTCGSRLWPTQRGVWFPSPVPRCCRGRGGRAGRRTKQQARGGWLLALCAPGCLPIAFIAGACGKRWPCRQVLAWDRAPTPGHPGPPDSPPVGAPDGVSTSSSSLSSSLDGAVPGSGAGALASCSCSTRLRRARMRWCRAAYSWPVSLELAWGQRGDPSSVNSRTRSGEPDLPPQQTQGQETEAPAGAGLVLPRGHRAHNQASPPDPGGLPLSLARPPCRAPSAGRGAGCLCLAAAWPLPGAAHRDQEDLHALVLSVHGRDSDALLAGLVHLHLGPQLGVEDQSQAALGPHHCNQ